MADKTTVTRKKPVSQKRVAMVLASLVGTMTISAAMLLLMEGGAMGTAVPGFAAIQPDIKAIVEPETNPLQADTWNFIIIYESDDLAASVDSLADGRLSGGSSPTTSTTVRPKANFHFVIDSAQSGNGRMDGEPEVGTSWNEQSPGAPYAGWQDPRNHFTPYNNAVGICIAGDLNRKPISQAQYQTLLQLVKGLQQRLNIPNDRVLFQWDPRFKAMQPSPAQQAFAAGFKAALQ